MRKVLPLPKGLPMEEAEGKITRIAGLNDLRVWRIKRYYIMTKEHTESRFEADFSPWLTGFLHKGAHSRVCFRLSQTGFVGFHWPGLLIVVLMFAMLAASASRYNGIPLWLVLVVTAVILGVLALLTYGFSCTQGGDQVLHNMNAFLEELQEELENYSPAQGRPETE